MLTLGDDTVDALLEQAIDTRSDQHLATVAARGDNRSGQSGLAGRPNVAHRAFIGFHTIMSDHAQNDLVLPITEPSDGLRIRWVGLFALG